jgi:hypothetical protein
VRAPPRPAGGAPGAPPPPPHPTPSFPPRVHVRWPWLEARPPSAERRAPRVEGCFVPERCENAQRICKWTPLSVVSCCCWWWWGPAGWWVEACRARPLGPGASSGREARQRRPPAARRGAPLGGQWGCRAASSSLGPFSRSGRRRAGGSRPRRNVQRLPCVPLPAARGQWDALFASPPLLSAGPVPRTRPRTRQTRRRARRRARRARQPRSPMARAAARLLALAALLAPGLALTQPAYCARLERAGGRGARGCRAAPAPGGAARRRRRQRPGGPPAGAAVQGARRPRRLVGPSLIRPPPRRPAAPQTRRSPRSGTPSRRARPTGAARWRRGGAPRRPPTATARATRAGASRTATGSICTVAATAWVRGAAGRPGRVFSGGSGRAWAQRARAAAQRR